MGIKIEYWDRAFFSYLQAADQRPFVWGEFDCCLFAADAVQAMTDQDPAASIRGTYSDAVAAAAVIANYGGIAELAEAFFLPMGAIEIMPLFARRGDVVRLVMPVFEDAFAECGGICTGRDVAFLTDSGTRSVSLVAAAAKLSARVWSFD